MAAEGKNEVASSLLDLQPSAVLELFRVYPDKINKPNLFLGFHGGALYDKSLIWQGVQYLPLALESEGFDLLADGKLARPKIKVGNTNNIVTNLLQNHKDFVNARVVRKRVSVRFLDDTNFDGGNPFGVADPTAELTNELWLMGRKIQESKIFVEFELNSPLDLENFTVNSRGVVAKFCYWQYRGEGCRYEGFPIEKEDGSPFVDADGNSVVPNWPSSYATNSAINFFTDPTAVWEPSTNYVKGDIVVVQSPTVFLSDNLGGSQPLKTAYVCVTGTTANPTVGQAPEGNPTYWQKDGCTKKFPACQKRFNEYQDIVFRQSQNVQQTFDCVKISGSNSVDSYPGPANSGVFHTHADEVTGVLTGDFTIVGWANTNFNIPYGAGILSTSSRDDDHWPVSRFINIGGGQVGATADDRGSSAGTDMAFFASRLNTTNPDSTDNIYNVVGLNPIQREGNLRDWNQYSIVHSTGTQELINAVENGEDVNAHDKFKELQTNLTISLNREPQVFPDAMNGNFESYNKRATLNWPTADEPYADRKALPQTFMLGGVEQQFTTDGYEEKSTTYVSSINGAIGPWALWNRVLTATELDYLYKVINPPNELEADALENNFTVAPRPYSECTGQYEDITGNSLIAWWDGTTGIIGSTTETGMLDIHTVGPYHLTGSGHFSGIQETYQEAPVTLVSNPTPPNPRYGGFPGTDGFSYGRNTETF